VHAMQIKMVIKTKYGRAVLAPHAIRRAMIIAKVINHLQIEK
jgi:hypothetical protein